MTSTKEIIKPLTDPEVAEHLKKAGEIADQVMTKLVQQCKPGQKVALLCTRSDNLIVKKLNALDLDEEITKGVSFPTSISFTEMAGFYSPLSGKEIKAIEKGDLLKIDLGVQIDGYSAIVNQSIVVGNTETNPVTGDIAKLLSTGKKIMSECITNIRPGVTNTAITKIITDIEKESEIKMVTDVYSHSMEKDVDEGTRKIAMVGNKELSVEKITFEENEIYTLDVLLTTGNGKLHVSDHRPTIFKRDKKKAHQLGTKAGRQVLSYVKRNHLNFPFHTKEFKSIDKAWFGCKECTKAGLFIPYSTQQGSKNEPIVNFKATVMILAEETVKVTGIYEPPMFLDLTEKVVEKKEETNENEIKKETNEKKKTDVKGKGRGRGRGKGRGRGRGKKKGKGRGRGKNKNKKKKKK
ncbi:proliferation-associated protein 2g4 [Anaeramoeba flamelloides]|uniref:Proliferation-associated protein 2g4 n=1 Tax=Anaeramoeba flamelloides TaxID=1746091 RepID=A0ABQ8ZEZ4_9EUKA|nr:proliferation-associated protein 2g4 [Anaeramoeba flamelloides]